MRILVVDDDPEFREELTHMLTDKGHTTESAPSAVQAIHALEGAEFDVMFTDLRMGRQSGMDLLRDARERWPRLLIVMLTGRATVETAVRSLQLGAFDYLRKPIRADQVERVLHLVSQQLALIRAGAKPLDPGRYASSLAAEGGYEVLLISPSPYRATTEKVSHLTLDAENPLRIRDAVETFVMPKDRAAVGTRRGRAAPRPAPRGGDRRAARRHPGSPRGEGAARGRVRPHQDHGHRGPRGPGVDCLERCAHDARFAGEPDPPSRPSPGSRMGRAVSCRPWKRPTSTTRRSSRSISTN